MDINNLNSVNGIKKELSPYVFEDALEKFEVVSKGDLDWLKELLDYSLDDYVKTYFIDKAPNASNYVLLDLSEHFSEVSGLVNKTISKRTEILEMETQALLRGVEYVQILSSIDSDKKLNTLNLNAAFQQSGFNDLKEYEQALETKRSLVISNLKTKLSFHKEIGNPLNYGERINNLRDIYCDNIKKIYERLIAIKRTLLFSFGTNTMPIPNIEDINILDKLILWLREVLFKYEADSQTDYIFNVSYSINNPYRFKDSFAATLDEPGHFLSVGDPHADTHLNADGKAIEILVSDAIQSLKNSGKVEFEVSGENVIKDASSDNLAMRILGVSVNVIEKLAVATNTNNLQRDTKIYHYELLPPQQYIALETQKIYASKESKDLLDGKHKLEDMLAPSPGIADIVDLDKKGNPVFKKPEYESVSFPQVPLIGQVQPIWSKSANENIDFQTDNSIRCISPIGTWKFSINNISPSNLYRATGLSLIEDIVITFRIGTRQKRSI